MSLVAYGASDDSDVSDSESDVKVQVQQQKRSDPVDTSKNTDSNALHTKVEDQISDDEDDYHMVSSSSLTKNILSEFPLTNSLESSSDRLPSLHSELPPPREREETLPEETELEDEVRQKPAEIANAPKPPKKKQPVKITIPSLEDVSDEEGTVSKKKSVSSSAPSGLFALLPAPVHSSKKEINRPLIPHSLSKKPVPSRPLLQGKSVSSSSSPSSTSVQSKPNGLSANSTQQGNSLINYASDDDDEDEEDSSTSQNFFSLGSLSKKTTANSNEADSVSSTVEISESSSKGPVVQAENSIRLPAVKEVSSPSVLPEPEPQPEPGLVNDSPLDFGHATRFSAWSSASSSQLGGWRPNSSTAQHSSGAHTSAQYNMADSDMMDSHGDLRDDDLQQVIQDKEFQRLQGRRKRGMDEAISFVDANVDDYVDPSELSKHITEESEYQPKKNKEDMPTGQQKRKKQITYLAFQAKEKELELKNTWAQNKLTRRQTQAKYGF